MKIIDVHSGTRLLYRDYAMLRHRMHGASLTALSTEYGVSKATVGRRVRRTFYDVQVMLMNETQGDPDSPRESLFTLDEFNRDPQKCRMTLLNNLLTKLENAYPALKSD